MLTMFPSTSHITPSHCEHSRSGSTMSFVDHPGGRWEPHAVAMATMALPVGVMRDGGNGETEETEGRGDGGERIRGKGC